MATPMLHIYLMGLVVLMPSKDEKTVTILLQESRREPHHVHFPVLIYDKNNITTTVSDDGDEIKKALNVVNEPRGFFLNGVDIRLGARMVGGLKTLIGIHKSSWIHPWIGTVPGSRGETEDSFWIPKMAQVAPGSEKVAKRHLNDEVSACDVAARLKLEHGTIKTFGLASRQAAVRSLTFKKLSIFPCLRGIKKALADTVLIEIPLAQDTVDIFTKKYGGTEGKLLSLKAHDGIIEILIGNLTRLVENPDAGPSMHFALYQKLSAKPQHNVRIPHKGMWRKVDEVKVEPPLPKIIQYVSGDLVDKKGRILQQRNGEAGTDRPMCTVVLMSEPSS